MGRIGVLKQLRKAGMAESISLEHLIADIIKQSVRMALSDKAVGQQWTLLLQASVRATVGDVEVTDGDLRDWLVAFTSQRFWWTVIAPGAAEAADPTGGEEFA